MLARMILGFSFLLGLFGTSFAGNDDSHPLKLWALHKHEQTVVISAISQDNIGRLLASNDGELSIDCTSTNAELTNTYRILTISLADSALQICSDKRIAIYPGQRVRQKIKTLRHNGGVQYQIGFYLTKQSDAATGAYWSTKCELSSRGLTIIGTISAPKTCFN